jgi:hypothetical protein
MQSRLKPRGDALRCRDPWSRRPASSFGPALASSFAPGPATPPHDAGLANIEEDAIMARKKSKPLEAEFVMFDVVYEDGSRTSNRRVPTSLLGGLDGDEPAREAIMEQDQIIAEKSGKPALAIASLSRSGKVVEKPARKNG